MNEAADGFDQRLAEPALVRVRRTVWRQQRPRPFLRNLRAEDRRPLRQACGIIAKGGIDRISGRQPFSELTRDFAPERRRRNTAIKDKLPADMPLHELRRARALTQQVLAETLNVNQPAVAKLDQRADICVTSLRSCIEAAGGRPKIAAEFPDAEVTIATFSRLGGGT